MRNTMQVLVIALGLFAITFFLVTSPVTSQANAATVTTDKDDYVPGETVIITGSGWQPWETVELYILEEPEIHPGETLYADADGAGEISNNEYVIQDHDLGQTFTLTATGLTSGMIAQTTFTDAANCTVAADCDAAKECETGPFCVAGKCQYGNAAAGIACTADAKLCTLDQCDGAGKCDHPTASSGTLCRASAGTCDVVETCDGSSKDCPADAVAGTGVVCNAANGVCDVAENCDGTNKTCPADAVAGTGVVCNAANGVCDVAENCDGTNKTCPADAVAGTGVVCNAANGVCDVAENCDGTNKTCPADAKSSAECRASEGACDPAESCDGVGNDCPADAKSSAECRASEGACDPAESCDGVGNDCPSDAKSSAECRASEGACDPAESCDGVGNDCPADELDDSFCDDSDICTDDMCEPSNSESDSDGCLITSNPSNDPSCENDLICKGPGFYSTHGGSEKSGKSARAAVNVTQMIIDAAGGCVEICGEKINATDTDNADSALEGLCVSPKSDPKIKVYRMLITTALNCIVSGFGPDCMDAPEDIAMLFDECNMACINGDTTMIKSCVDELDCVNNGGAYDNGFCQTGECSDNMQPCNESDHSNCGVGAVCVQTDGCDDLPLVNEDLSLYFDPEPAASSPKACNAATKSSCTGVGSDEDECNTGTMSLTAETCP